MTPRGDRIVALLEAERQLFREGHLAAAEGAISRLAAVEAELREESLQQDDLARVREAAERLGNLVLASARGVRAARRRLLEISNVGATGGTYTRDGSREAIPAPGSDTRA